MRALLKFNVKWSGVGWFWFWSLALLVLPNCSLDSEGNPLNSNLNRGPGPHTSAIFCDIEVAEGGRHCASPEEIESEMRMAGAAIALVAGDTRDRALDYSDEARDRCDGDPEVVIFLTPFPEGRSVCLNCTAIGPSPSPHPSPSAACLAFCHDLFGGAPPSLEAQAFCAGRTRISTNFPPTGCFTNACINVTTSNPSFKDPRETPEPVIWQPLNGASDNGGTLKRTEETSGMWDVGSASTEEIKGGDGYVEFTATETNLARVGGLSGCCLPDDDPGFTGIGYGIDLFSNGEISIFESGELISTFGAYTAGEKFRVKVKDKFNGRAEISYARIIGPCVDGSPCNEAVFYTSETTAEYPIRVDASLFDEGATLTNVRLVRIIP